MKKLISIFLLLAFSFCTDSPDSTSNLAHSSKESQDTNLTESVLVDSGTKVRFNFSKNKNLLDAILILPDSVFATWEWKIKDRTRWYNEIKSNDYYIDNDPNFFTQTHFEPNYAKFTIVDGTWSISLYNTSDNSTIVIANDVAGDGNDINIYEINANKIRRSIELKDMFGDYFYLIKRKDGGHECTKKFEEINVPIFSFDFSDHKKAEIESSWYLTKSEYSDCLEGNSLSYNFNPDTKKFDLEKIIWKEKTDD